MSDEAREISVVVDMGDAFRDEAAKRESIPVAKLAAEVQNFVADIADILDKAARAVAGPARLSDVTVSASIEMGGRISLLGTGVQTKGQAGISFKFIISTDSA